ncbi:hypothetical protein C8F04DRAFT_1293870 [Mycena alexandri]|uniref:Uncharacterized protein n=1 Tax=Mycena alexandri TaxID=1745969 RepID=A0AAD6SHL8_9AGAR|nr:hypothetical protein C8F04DRAFT_1293870 [Mycena alexandri]
MRCMGPSTGNWFDRHSGKRAILPLFTRSSAPNIVSKAGIPLQKTLERLRSNKIGWVRIVVVESKSKDGAGAEAAVRQNDSQVSAYHSPDCGVRAATEPVETELEAHSHRDRCDPDVMPPRQSTYHDPGEICFTTDQILIIQGQIDDSLRGPSRVRTGSDVQTDIQTDLESAREFTSPRKGHGKVGRSDGVEGWKLFGEQCGKEAVHTTPGSSPRPRKIRFKEEVRRINTYQPTKVRVFK